MKSSFSIKTKSSGSSGSSVGKGVSSKAPSFDAKAKSSGGGGSGRSKQGKASEQKASFSSGLVPVVDFSKKPLKSGIKDQLKTHDYEKGSSKGSGFLKGKK